MTSTVKLLEGQTSATFSLTGVDDAIADGTQTVTIGASAAGFTGGCEMLDVTDVEASNSFLNFIAPGSRIANGLEDGVNSYLDDSNLTLTSLTTTDGEITLVLD